MPQVLALIAAGAGVYAGLRYLSRRVFAAKPDKTEPREVRNVRDPETLEWDAESGVYRPTGKRRG